MISRPLPRPHIPFEVCCRVLLVQLGTLPHLIDRFLAENKGRYEAYHNELKPRLAEQLNCKTDELHLDHTLPLAARKKIRNEFGEVVGYDPDANDPDYLRYRVRVAHEFKTNKKGDGAQFRDRALINRQKRREQPPKRRSHAIGPREQQLRDWREKKNT